MVASGYVAGQIPASLVQPAASKLFVPEARTRSRGRCSP